MRWGVLNSYVYFFWNSEFWNRNSDFSAFQQQNSKKNPTGIFGIKNIIKILLPMGVPEIRTKDWNSQPSLQVLSWTAQGVKFVCNDFESALQSCLMIHLDCLTAVKSNLFGPQDCLKRCRGGHQGELIPLLGSPLAPTMWLSGEPVISIVSSCGRSSSKKGWWHRLWML